VELPTAVAATIACVALSAALALCAWRRRIGLLVLGFVLVGIGMFWIALQGPPISGPLVWSSGSHGIHANDWWGLAPIGAGTAALWRSLGPGPRTLAKSPRPRSEASPPTTVNDPDSIQE